ncbi:MAG: hypothetical protein K2X87_02260 [Gemmataceae bacterium]|nr:hypothetical protein [Gemmataceae bacterium]
MLRSDGAHVYPPFLRRWVRGPEWWEQVGTYLNGGAIFDNLKCADIPRFTLTLPSLGGQRAIAGVLGALDDEIAANRRLARTLEALGRAVFRSWFVDFDSVTARAAGRRPVGMPAAVADLFPTAFTDSPLGPIPQSWRVAIVGETCRLKMGQSPPGSTYNEVGDGLPFFQGRADFTERFPIRRVYCTAPTRFADTGDTLVSVRAPVGDINVAAERCAVGRGLSAVRHKSGSVPYTYYMMDSLRPTFDEFEGDGTFFGAINKAGFEAIKVIEPPDIVRQAFDRIACPVADRLAAAERLSRTLAALRGALLPRLLSGERRVRAAGRVVGTRPVGK